MGGKDKGFFVRYRWLIPCLGWLLQWKYFRIKLGEKVLFWCIHNIKEIKIDSSDKIGKYRLICKGTVPNVKCEWQYSDD